ncbi:MAG: amidohydrolase [Acidobacteria bacterium]|nr:amidohydrolase [Acidobacteriota bacterium]
MRLISISLFLCAALGAALDAATADLIVSAGKVVTMDGQRRVIENGAVAVVKGRIVAVGPKAEIDRAYTAARRIDRPTAILTPGLVNAHAHAPMALLRGIADDRDLDDWLRNFIFPAEAKNVNEEFVRVGTRLAVLEMMQGGITTYADMYYYEHAIADETRKAGMRGVLGQTIIGFPAPDYKTPKEALAATERYILAFKNDALITPSVAPHAIYTNSAETLTAARELANKYGVPYLIHVSETKKEQVDAAAAHKMSPTQYLESLGALTGRTVMAHMVWADAADLAVSKKREAGLVHCPSSNTKLASGVAPVPAMLKEGLRVGLGTDGPAGSNNDESLFEEMDLAAKLAKVTTMDPKTLPAQAVFEMATLGGARALTMEKEIGSLEPGKRADLIAVSTQSAHAQPAHDPYSMLVFALKSSDVTDVVIEGRITVENRRALTLNEAEVLRQAAAIRAKVDASLK